MSTPVQKWTGPIPARHVAVLGEHEHEWDAAREARALFPGHPVPVVLEARALAGLDRPVEAEQRAEKLPMLPLDATETAAHLVEIGDALGAHGHGAAATRMYERALRSWQQHGSPTTPRQHRAYADLLRRLGRLGEAAEHGALAHSGAPEDGVAHALVGLIAAQRGDRREAEQILAELAARRDPYDRGRTTYGRARLRSHLGDLDRAVELLRQAHAQGMAIGYDMHFDHDLRPLRGHPRYEELIRPKG